MKHFIKAKGRKRFKKALNTSEKEKNEKYKEHTNKMFGNKSLTMVQIIKNKIVQG